MQVTDEMVEAAWVEFQNAFHEHADTDEGYRAITRRAITAALAKAWRPIEGAPKDGSEFIAGNIGYQPFSCIWSQRDRCFLHFKDGGEAISYGFDYWMPLPAPPPQQEGE